MAALTQPIESEEGLLMRCPDGSAVPDPFLEEQALVVRTGLGVVVFVGCAHRGLLNTIDAARQASGDSRVRAIFGGAHLRSATRARIQRTARVVAQGEPELVVLGHCTGSEAEDIFAGELGDTFQPLRAGSEWALA